MLINFHTAQRGDNKSVCVRLTPKGKRSSCANWRRKKLKRDEEFDREIGAHSEATSLNMVMKRSYWSRTHKEHVNWFDWDERGEGDNKSHTSIGTCCTTSSFLTITNKVCSTSPISVAPTATSNQLNEPRLEQRADQRGQSQITPKWAALDEHDSSNQWDDNHHQKHQTSNISHIDIKHILLFLFTSKPSSPSHSDANAHRNKSAQSMLLDIHIQTDR